MRHRQALGLFVALIVVVAASPVPDVSAMPARAPQPPAGTTSGPPALRHAPNIRLPKPKTLAPGLAPASSWTWQNPKPNGNPLYAISCPTASTCFAGGGNGPILMTANSGTSWTAQATVSGLYSLSCPSASMCVAVGDLGMVWTTSNGGATWSPQTINGGNYLAGVSCPSTTVCFAVGYQGAVFTTSNGGTSWSAQTSGTTSNLYSISCPSATSCFAVGANRAIVVTTNGGSGWGPQYLSGQGAFTLTGISCSAVSACSLVGIYGSAGILSSTVDGTTWSFPSQMPAALSGVGCPSTVLCIATQFNGAAFVLGQYSSGASSTGESGALFAISCPAADVCFAAGDYSMVVTTSNGGTGWKAKPPSGRQDFSIISCASTSTCLVAGGTNPIYNAPNAVGTSDGGATWITQNSIDQVAVGTYLGGLSCPSVTTCYALDVNRYTLNPEILRTINGGTDWTATQLTFTQEFLFAISCATTVACHAVGTNGLIVATTDGVHWGGQYGGSPTPGLTSVNCPSASVCFATLFNGGMLATTDGGANWTRQTTAATGWRSLSCPSTGSCYAVGDHGIVATADGGTTWSSQTPIGVNEIFSSVSCATSTNCVAATWNGDIFATTDGTTWTAQTSGTTNQLNSVSCASVSNCFAVGASGLIIGTTDGGATWKHLAPTGPSEDQVIAGMSCLTATTCFAVANGNNYYREVFATSDGGQFWSSVLLEPSVTFTGISCPSSTTCFVIGKSAPGGTAVAQLFGTADGGATWPIQLTLNSAEILVGISCPTTTTCFAVTSQGSLWTTSNGWAGRQEIGVTGTGLSAISCPSTTTCFAADNVQGGGGGMYGPPEPGNIFSTTNGGLNWNLSFSLGHDTQASVIGPFSSISCPTTTTCYAGSQYAFVASTSDGGANWHTDNVPTGSPVFAINCPAPSTCFVGTNSGMLHTTDFGASWDQQFSGAFVATVSCPTAAVCFGGGSFGTITRTTNSGTAWAPEHPAGPVGIIAGLSCSGTSCYAAAGETIMASHDSGATWTSHTLTSGDVLLGISCPAASACVAVGWPGAVYRTVDGGTTWTYQPSPISRSDETLVSVSCSSVTTCVAVGTDGIALSTANGTTWNRDTSGTTQSLEGVSCPSAAFCVAVGRSGLTMTRNGGVWHRYSSGVTGSLWGIKCASASSCDAVGDAGLVLATANGGTTWATQVSGTAHSLYGIQCLQPGVCLAVGVGGTAVLTQGGGTWTTVPLPTNSTLLSAAFTDSGQAEVGGVGGTILANPSLIDRCTSAGLSSIPVSPLPRGGVVAVTATSNTCQSPRYEFWLQFPSGTWVMEQPFGGATWSWDTSTFPIGNYVIHVWANQTGHSTATWEAYGELKFSVTKPPPCATAGLSPLNPSAAAGTTVHLTGSSTGCPNPVYEFWVQYPNRTWNLIQKFGLADFMWSTGGLAPGTYTVHVWANQSGDSKATYEAYGSDLVTLTGCTSPNVSANPQSPQAAGTSVTFTAGSSTCPSPVYEFWLQYPGGSWYPMQGFMPGVMAWQWNTAGFPKGSYVLHVWANNQGSSYTTWESYATTSYVLT